VEGRGVLTKEKRRKKKEKRKKGTGGQGPGIGGLVGKAWREFCGDMPGSEGGEDLAPVPATAGFGEHKYYNENFTPMNFSIVSPESAVAAMGEKRGKL